MTVATVILLAIATLKKNKHHNDWSEIGQWETIGFPWDYDDVSMHTAEELAQMLAKLNRGENDWDEEGESLLFNYM